MEQVDRTGIQLYLVGLVIRENAVGKCDDSIAIGRSVSDKSSCSSDQVARAMFWGISPSHVAGETQSMSPWANPNGCRETLYLQQKT